MTFYFAKRRVHSMLSEVFANIDASKRKDLAARLNSPSPDQVLPAEMELVLLWALTKLGPVEIEPERFDCPEKPDAFTDAPIFGMPAIIEITAHSNGRIAHEEAMTKTANRIAEYASTVKKRFSDRLWFSFPYTMSAIPGNHKRTPTARLDYKITEAGKHQIKSWIEAGEERSKYLHFIDGDVICSINCTAPMKIPMTQRVWTTVPPETHDLVDNPLYEALNRKRKQLSKIPQGIARVIFIADAGSTLLNKINKPNYSDWTNPKTADQIIERFLSDKKHDVDVVVVFTPRQQQDRGLFGLPTPIDNELYWFAKEYRSPEFVGDLATFEKVLKQLPPPQQEGYQARSSAQQYHTSKIRDRPYNGYKMTTTPDHIEIAVSARAVMDLMSGAPFDGIMQIALPEQIAALCARGYSIVGTSFKPGGIDMDDDYVIFRLEVDPARLPFPSQ